MWWLWSYEIKCANNNTKKSYTVTWSDMEYEEEEQEQQTSNCVVFLGSLYHQEDITVN